ncbi:hypothetical protein F4824DRAFT_386863 [Ustulina deusta]|nr:hypothetical protein F4824DRAFT_386863 [Ustulina deusta]
MSAQTRPDEQVVGIFDPLPHRYLFVPGTGALAAQCRARTHAIGRPVYVVHDSAGAVAGLRVPHYVVEAVIFEETLTGGSSSSSEGEERKEDRGGSPAADDESDSDWAYEAALRLCGLDPEGGGEFDWVDADGGDSDAAAADDEYVPSGDGGSGSGCDESEDESGEEGGTLGGSSDDGDELYNDMWFVKE